MPGTNEFDIAIVGMAGRFPGARNIDEFWRNLVNGVESITALTDDEILASGVPESQLRRSDYVKASPLLESPEQFDAAFFGFAPGEARALDPQHRLLLELAHEALEDAGCDPDRSTARIGVFAGTAMNTYFTNSELRTRFSEDYIPTLIGNDKDFLSTRISYKLNLRGPSLTVQSACSTSIVAVHLARQSLLSEECDIALAGAVSVRVPHRAGYIADGGGIVSPDGHVRPFDANANGTVFGSGGGILVLKRLGDAIASGDSVYAIIKGSAVNNDGSVKAGYTAPSVQGQADVVLEAIGNAGVDAESISYVEAHGSGTRVGDPIEIAALSKAFRELTTRTGFCAIGSVKSNVGHLDAAAGVAGIIKTALALKHGVMPPSLNYSSPNPEIDFPSSPFYVNTAAREWNAEGPRRASVMSTGMGGTNANVVLEEPPAADAAGSESLPQLLTISAATESALNAATTRLAEFLNGSDANLRDVAHTLQTGRRQFAHRRAVVCRDRADAVRVLTTDIQRINSGVVSEVSRPVVFLLPGVGDQYVGMGHGLYERWPVFRTEVDRCAAILAPHIGIDIREVLYPAGGEWQRARKSGGVDLRKMLARGDNVDPYTARLNETRFAQPALFAVEYAICRLWQSLGVTPAAIVGHSMGEYVAATLSGVFAVEDALRLVAKRAQLVNELPAGAMLAVTLAADQLAPFLRDGVTIALINGPELCVVAGQPEAVRSLENVLARRGIICRPVQNAHAFHSPMIDPVADALTTEFLNTPMQKPAIPFASNVTGSWISTRDAITPAYWVTHATRTARFNDALRSAFQLGDPVLIEAGPGRTLGVLAMQHPAKSPDSSSPVASLRHHYENHADDEVMLQAIGRAWSAGVAIDWDALPQTARGRKVSLPAYPFERKEYWLPSILTVDAPASREVSQRKNPKADEWLYVPSWTRASVNAEPGDTLSRERCTWLVFADDAVSPLLSRQLEAAGHSVITVAAGDRYEHRSARAFAIRPGVFTDYEHLAETIALNKFHPDRIVHAWNLGDASDKGEGLSAAQEIGFYSLVHLARAFAARNAESDIRLFVLSESVHDVLSTEPLHPEKATALGPCMVIPQEYANVRVTNIDVDLVYGGADATAMSVLREMLDTDAKPCVAYRNGQRWLRTYERIRSAGTVRTAFRARGVYLITGGTGRVASVIAEYLAREYQARLVLVSRSQSLRADVRDRIVASGGEVVVLNANVAELSAMQRVVAETYRRFGTLHGVIHGAGIVGADGYAEIKDCTREHAEKHFNAKARGARVLETVLDGKSIDFCMLLSSLTAVLGGIGQVAYTSANIYLDTFARAHNRRSRTPWLSVDWDVWRVDADHWSDPALGATLRDLGTTPAEATGLLDRLLARKGEGTIVVSTGDLASRIDQWIGLRSVHKERADRSPVMNAVCDTGDDAITDETERRIAQIWARVLGLSSVTRDDHFARLGGHSLLAVSIISELRRTFQLDLPIRVLFDVPTVAQLADYIKAQLIAEIDALSDDDAERLASTSP